MPASLRLPRLYPIADAGLLHDRAISIEAFAANLFEAGIRFLQYRDKADSDQDFLRRALLLRKIFQPGESTLILNDRAWLAVEAGADGVHVGQEDLEPERVRAILDSRFLLGVSTHNLAQFALAESGPADYVAIGPVFPTFSKQNPDPVIGLEGIRVARRLTRKPLVAIGGITRLNCRSVFEAGADSVAVISGLLGSAGAPGTSVVRDFLDACAGGR